MIFYIILSHIFGTVVRMNGAIYVIGGENELAELEKSVEVVQYNTRSSKYETSAEIIDKLPSGRSKCSSIVHNDTIWIIGKIVTQKSLVKIFFEILKYSIYIRIYTVYIIFS